MSNYCIVPARGSSKGIPRKNLRSFSGQPLFWHSINAARESLKFDSIIVSSEDTEILNRARDYGSDIRDRPKHLSQDHIHSIHVVLDCIDYFKLKQEDLVCMLLPTSPLRKYYNVAHAVDLFSDSTHDSLVGVCIYDATISGLRYIKDDRLDPISVLDNFEKQRQDEQVYKVNGAIYISSVRNLIEKRSFHQGRVLPFVMSKEDSIDINDEVDWKIAESLI